MIGIDIIEVTRIKNAIEQFGERFLCKIYTQDEINFCTRRKNKYQSFASRFAAKEAVMKALGTGHAHGVKFTDIEIVDDEKSAPHVNLYGKALEYAKGRKPVVSLSHIKDYAIAVCILINE